MERAWFDSSVPESSGCALDTAVLLTLMQVERDGCMLGIHTTCVYSVCNDLQKGSDPERSRHLPELLFHLLIPSGTKVMKPCGKVPVAFHGGQNTGQADSTLHL